MAGILALTENDPTWAAGADGLEITVTTKPPAGASNVVGQAVPPVTV
jgi:hypothetical protein